MSDGKGGNEMNGAIEYFKAVTAPKREQTDRMDEEGYVVCGICGERKQQEIRVPESIHPSGRWRVPTACRCERMRAEAYERRIVKQEGIAHRKKLFLWSETTINHCTSIIKTKSNINF